MTRTALIADIHGNAVALQAALDRIELLDVDGVVCLGDVAATGPQPHEATAALRRRAIPTIMGNADAEILDPSDPTEAEGSMVRFLEISAWGGSQLDDDDRAFLGGLQPSLEFDLGGSGTLLCVHGSPRSYDEAIRADTAPGDLDAMLDGRESLVIAAGHTHLPLLRRHRHQLVINPGSVGLAYDPVPPAENVGCPGWAEFAILDADGGQLAVSFHRVPYEVDPLLAVARASGMPHAEWWAGFWRGPA